MRRPRRGAGGLRPLLLLIPFAALLSVATFSLHYSSDRLLLVIDTPRQASPSSSRHVHRLPVSGLGSAAPPLHAAAARAFRSGGRLLRDVLSSPSSTAPAAPPSGIAGAAVRCPPSVAVSGARLRVKGGGGVDLSLPCGLTLGSHVTVVGSPRRRGDVAQFAVELRGEGDGDAAPTILHFNPRLRGDWSGRPVIEQNTRFRGQWGPALRCDGHRSRPDEETGQNGRREVNENLLKEANFFGDIVIVPFIDSYDLVVLKTVAICDYAARVVPAKYVMKCDDDTFVRLDSVMAEVKKISDGKSLYLGNMNYYHRPLREGKWAVSFEEWPQEEYPPYADGAGYIVSSDIASFVASEMEKGRLNLFKMEDVSMGMWVGRFDGSRNAVVYAHSPNFCQSGCVDGYLTAHYQSPAQMVCLWEKLRLGTPQCCNAR
nr:unnamed protein product [Digitaria exilis]